MRSCFAGGDGEPRFDALDLGAEAHVNALLVEPAVDLPGRLLAQPCRVWLWLVRDQRDAVAAAAQRCRDLAADETRPDDDNWLVVTQACNELAHVIEGADDPHAGVIGTGHSDARRLGPGCEQRVAVLERAPAGDHDLTAVGVEADRAATDERDPPLAQPVVGFQRELVLAHLATQQLLGQRRTAIGHAVLVGDNCDAALTSGVPIAARGGDGRWTTTDDQPVVALAHRRSSTSSR